MWLANMARAIRVRVATVPGIRQLLEARWRTKRATAKGHEAADRAERLIDQYREQDRAGW